MGDVLAFVARYFGQTVRAAGGIGGECVDLANQYLNDVYGAAHVYRNAVDWAGMLLPGWRWVENSPVNAPPTGALVVWKPYPLLGVGSFGHIAVALLADEMQLLSFDQNWSARAALPQSHTYGGVVGWHERVVGVNQ